MKKNQYCQDISSSKLESSSQPELIQFNPLQKSQQVIWRILANSFGSSKTKAKHPEKPTQ
jgi:hypothetical protein